VWVNARIRLVTTWNRAGAKGRPISRAPTGRSHLVLTSPDCVAYSRGDRFAFRRSCSRAHGSRRLASDGPMDGSSVERDRKLVSGGDRGLPGRSDPTRFLRRTTRRIGHTGGESRQGIGRRAPPRRRHHRVPSGRDTGRTSASHRSEPLPTPRRETGEWECDDTATRTGLETRDHLGPCEQAEIRGEIQPTAGHCRTTRATQPGLRGLCRRQTIFASGRLRLTPSPLADSPL
jgi:hypothetical protein